ncbi:MAG: hypothetical protein VB067_05685, partial [Christensenellaceae bacterium]|nr:hypothetical protein [Christensenellaceae bacterium]
PKTKPDKEMAAEHGAEGLGNCRAQSHVLRQIFREFHIRISVTTKRPAEAGRAGYFFFFLTNAKISSGVTSASLSAATALLKLGLRSVLGFSAPIWSRLTINWSIIF